MPQKNVYLDPLSRGAISYLSCHLLYALEEKVACHWTYPVVKPEQQLGPNPRVHA